MSPGDRAEGVARLRRAVAAIESRREAAPAHVGGRLPLTRALDRALGGGLADDGLHEIAPASPGDGPAAIGFALALAARFIALRRHTAIVMAEDFALAELGPLYGPGLAAFGLDPRRLVFVRTPDAPALFQAMEDALKSGASAAVVGEAWRLKAYDLAASRRLLLAARAGGDAGAARRRQRLWRRRRVLQRRRDALRGRRRAERPSFFGRRRARPAGRAGLRRPTGQGAHRRRRRGAGADPTRIFRLVWRAEELSFDQPTLSLPVAAAADERSRAARA